MYEVIDFYYEFSSPYAYLGACLIDELAERHGRGVNWRPFMLGAVFKREGTAPLVNYPMKGRYSLHDMKRTARHHGIDFRMPDKFPILTVNAARLVYWAGDQDPGERQRLSMVFFQAVFKDGLDISKKDVLRDVCERAGLDWGICGEVIADPVYKERLKDETDAALDRGVFGAPFFIVDGEPFWGVDKMRDLDLWLETGGW